MATQALITVTDVMDFGNLDDTSLTARIEALLGSVFAAAEQYCDRKFSSDQFTEYFDALDTEQIGEVTVANPPMTALVSVTDDAQYSARAIDTNSNVLWIEERKRVGEVKLHKAESYFSGGLAAVKVIYTGGYTSATIPADLKEAICQEVLFRLNTRSVGVGSESADGASQTLRMRNGFAEEVTDVLDRYRLWHRGVG